MSCYGCGSAFSAFKREHGCKNCGFAFCMKCMPNKYPIAKLNNEKHRVCMKCYNILSGKVKPKDENPAKYSPPENYKKRMAALEEREASGHKSDPSHSKHTQGHSVGAHKSQHKNLSKADRDIQERLEKLREKKTPQELEAAKVTAQDLENRLAKMKGMDPSRYNSSNKPVYHAPDRRTQQEQMNDLLDEISNEVELDSRLPDPVQEIASRLAKLKQPEKPDNVENKSSGDENNLNKPSLKDSQSFSHNISTSGNQTPNTKDVQASTGSKDEPNPANVDDDSQEVSPEDVSRILNEAAQELEQDAQKALKGLQEDKDIMKRLQEIKQRRKESSSDVNKDEDDTVSGSENEEDEIVAQSIIRQAIEENKLYEAAARDGHDTSKMSKDSKKITKKIVNTDEEWYDPDELPYCCICTEDATLRCVGCDRDLYCQQCFKEGHKELGLTDHVTLKYTPPVEEGTT